MGKGKDISASKISEIETLLCFTLKSQRQIASISDVSKSVVNRIKKKLNQKSSLKPNRVGKCGRPRITTPRTDRKIRQICLENRKLSVGSLTHIATDYGIEVSKRTVQRRLAEEGLLSHRPAIKPRLTDIMKKKRLQWAKKYKIWGLDEWNKVRLILLLC